MRFLSPKTDFAFKKIFGSRQSKGILISFLNALLYGGTETIVDLEIIDPYQVPPTAGLKDSFLDVKATVTTVTGMETVIIEMQVLNVSAFQKRVLYNAAKAFCIQLESGHSYTRLNPVIALTITDFEMFPEHNKVISRYYLKEEVENSVYTDAFRFVFVELPKFHKSLEELETLTDQWIYFVKTAGTLEGVPESLTNSEPLNQAFTIAERGRLSRKELEILEKQEMFIEDQRNHITLASQQGLEQGIQQGIQQGLEQGIQQGIQQGLEQGIQQGLEQGVQQGQRQQAIDIARSLLGILPVDVIAEKTGLTIAEVEGLQEPQD
ncbi:MAG: Rpn family recombination-promoting nuclease/putative transposase [Prochlorothrix sp.]|nr:Rpn family recombination-promoting nuclease/putative transposase [Prochlorothrix sp.]